MKNLNRYTVIPIFIVLVHIFGCAPATVPKKELTYKAVGEWTSVTYQTGDSKLRVHGELIAIHSDQIFILATRGLTTIPSDSVSRMELNNNSDQRMTYPAKSLNGFLPYARFPQGFPKDIDRQSIYLPERAEAIIAAEQDAYARHNESVWFLVGCCGGVFYGGGIIVPYVVQPGVPSDSIATRFVGKSSNYVTLYTTAYKAKAKNLRINSTLNGFAVLTGSTVGSWGVMCCLAFSLY